MIPLIQCFLYFSYIDDIFMTTNEDIDEIEEELQIASKKDMNIKINYEINASVNFLDITITNEGGSLRTTMYHKPTTEPYILPFTSDHPRHIHCNIPYAALLRAARLCSHVDDFNLERIRVDMSLLLNGYPPSFISQQFDRFFKLNHAMPALHQLNEEVYHYLHQSLSQQPTRREKQLNAMMRDPAATPLILQTKQWDKEVMYLHYLFDRGLTMDLPRELHRWWKTHYAFNGSPIEQIKVRIIAKTNPTVESFFIRKKPPLAILTKMEI